MLRPRPKVSTRQSTAHRSSVEFWASKVKGRKNGIMLLGFKIEQRRLMFQKVLMQFLFLFFYDPGMFNYSGVVAFEAGVVFAE